MPIAPDLMPAFGALALAVLALWMPAPAVRGNRDWLWCGALTVTGVLMIVTG